MNGPKVNEAPREAPCSVRRTLKDPFGRIRGTLSPRYPICWWSTAAIWPRLGVAQGDGRGLLCVAYAPLAALNHSLSAPQGTKENPIYFLIFFAIFFCMEEAALGGIH